MNVAHSATGTRLQREFGPAGLAAWIGLLAACKRSPIEGRISFASEAEAWQIIGILEPERLGFTLEEFLDTLGTLKQTRRTPKKTDGTRRGRVTNVEVTQWEQWQRPRSGARNTNAKPRQSERGTPPDQDQDQDQDNDPDPYLKRRAVELAIQEAKADPGTRSATGAGKYRYQENPKKYEALARAERTRQSCTQCDNAGLIWFRADGSRTTRDDPNAQTSEKCTHAA